ncbi:hypothetical protein F3Y22_tig00116996pilonHSYRG00069 [Hibiscus syriacus]|uniref:Morc S5 domain-containing protein n=1 Tax=Hibiscus syriacus TaxID=106335 RepID=A0A6A2WEV6_HIBSY|nr:hypothetical protein F3Y22_tig00116996pilonHSYRG00069 [Hibiscus syriacus]
MKSFLISIPPPPPKIPPPPLYSREASFTQHQPKQELVCAAIVIEDIQLRGVNRDEKNIQMAKEYPNSRTFIEAKFRIILRGKDVEHHNIVNDMMLTEIITYRPNPSAEGAPKDLNLAAVVTIGFVKDAKYHIDVQGFNVYHKNRLIETTNYHRIGYAPRRNKKGIEQSLDREEYIQQQENVYRLGQVVFTLKLEQKRKRKSGIPKPVDGGNGRVFNKYDNREKATIDTTKVTTKSGKGISSFKSSSPPTQDVSDDVCEVLPEKQANGSSQKFVTCTIKVEEKYEGGHQHQLLNDLQQERNRRQSLEIELSEALKKIEQLSLEQESIISIFSEERDKRDKEEEKLRKKLKVLYSIHPLSTVIHIQKASNTIQELLDKVRILEMMKSPDNKQERPQRLSRHFVVAMVISLFASKATGSDS